MDQSGDVFRESIDGLGSRPERHKVFSAGLLAETEDHLLQTIVEEAARDLGTPIALVNLVLEEIQFFKAHYGLPSDLAAARGTERDVSFCQFVVRDKEPFEVNDAKQDPRVPQYLVNYADIQSYLGFPLEIDEVIVGSLCVIDTSPRQFSDEDHQTLRKLADRVNARLAEISQSHRATQSILVRDAAAPALAELERRLTNMQAGAEAGRLSTAALSTFFRLLEHSMAGGYTSPGHLRRSLASAKKALENCENNLYNIEADAADASDIRLALEHGLIKSAPSRLSEVTESGWELARQPTRAVGGATWPELTFDPVLATPRSLAVVLISTCLSNIAARMSYLNLKSGISIDTENMDTQVSLCIGTTGLTKEAFQAIATELNLLTRENPSVAIQPLDDSVKLLFAIKKEAQQPK